MPFSLYYSIILKFQTLWQFSILITALFGRASANGVAKPVTRPVLLMLYVMRSKETPAKDKWAIFGSLAYLILPIDILDAKRLPIIGWLDEVASLAVLDQKMSKYITHEMECRADDQLDKWLPDYVEYEIIE